MVAQPHLFIEVRDGVWSALGSVGSVPPVSQDQMELGPEDGRVDGSLQDLEDGETIARAIEAELKRRGPLRLSELIQTGRKFLPRGRSQNSIQPIVYTNKDLFARPLPGFYALHHQVPKPLELLMETPSYVYDEDQVRVYALARRAGEAWGSYSLWSPVTEYLWCLWARRHGKTALLESLLSIAQIDEWPDVKDKAIWRERAENRHFRLSFDPNPESIKLPTLDRILAACLFLRSKEQIGWISANRLLFRRVSDHNAAGLLAVLISLGAVTPGIADWQLPHLAGPRLSELLRRVEDEQVRRGELTWTSEFGQALRAEALAAIVDTQGWVSRSTLLKMFAHKDEVPVKLAVDLNPLDQLLAERAAAERSDSLEEMLHALAGAELNRRSSI
jgi:hypothetical protein